MMGGSRLEPPQCSASSTAGSRSQIASTEQLVCACTGLLCKPGVAKYMGFYSAASAPEVYSTDAACSPYSPRGYMNTSLKPHWLCTGFFHSTRVMDGTDCLFPFPSSLQLQNTILAQGLLQCLVQHGVYFCRSG